MKKKTLLFLVASFLFASCNQTKKDYVENLVKITKEHKSMHFKITEKFYYSNGQDTTITPFEVWVVRDKSDTLRNGYVWVDNNYRPYNMIYEQGDFYLAIPPKKITTVYPGFTEDFISPADWISVFLKPESLTKQIRDSLNKAVISDTIFENEACEKIVIRFPDSDNGDVKTTTFILDEDHAAPLWAEYLLKTDDYTYTDELYFSDYEFNKDFLQDLKKRQEKVLKENPVERIGANSKTAMLERMLHIGDKAPLFQGNYYDGGKAFKLSDFIGKKVIIVDFWYTHCPPCVRAMPALSGLFDKYKEKGLQVFGLNSVDNQPHSMPNLKKFLKKRQLSYDVLMITPDVDIMYKISGYPTMYLVDKDGKIAYAEAGFDPESFETLKAKVEDLLGGLGN